MPPCHIGHWILVGAAIVAFQLSVQIGGKWQAQLVDVPSHQFLTGLQYVKVVGGIHGRGGDTVVLFVAAYLPESDLGLIDGQILRVERNVVCVLQGFDYDFHSSCELEIFGVLQIGQDTQMVLLGPQGRGKAVVAVAGIGVGRGQHHSERHHEQEKPLHARFCGRGRTALV